MSNYLQMMHVISLDLSSLEIVGYLLGLSDINTEVSSRKLPFLIFIHKCVTKW